MELNKVTREAALINMLEIMDAEDQLDRVRTELWCIREGIDAEEHPEIWDITMGAWATGSMVDWVLHSGFREKHEQAAFLLCTIRELS